MLLLRRLGDVQSNADRFGYTLFDSSMYEIITEQSGIFRTNCLDWCVLRLVQRLWTPDDLNSLDRTNFIQDILSRTSLEQHLFLVRREWIGSNSLWTNHRELWAENGDALSRIYAGTGALNTSFTRSGKRTFGGPCFCVTCGFGLLNVSAQGCCPMLQRASLGHTSIISKTKENSPRSTCSLYDLSLSRFRIVDQCYPRGTWHFKDLLPYMILFMIRSMRPLLEGNTVHHAFYGLFLITSIVGYPSTRLRSSARYLQGRGT